MSASVGQLSTGLHSAGPQGAPVPLTPSRPGTHSQRTATGSGSFAPVALQQQQQQPTVVTYHDEMPSAFSAFYNLFVYQYAVYSSLFLLSLIIALSIVYHDTFSLRDDISNNLRLDCKELSAALTTYLALVIIASFFALGTVIADHFLRNFSKHAFGVFAASFIVGMVALTIFNVVGTVFLGKPQSRRCYALVQSDSSELYEMIYGAVLVIWIGLVSPIVFIGVYVAYRQCRELTLLYPSASKIRETTRAEREMLMPTNPNRVFRYP